MIKPCLDRTPIRLPPGGLFPPLLEAAVRLAARGHYNQFRKSVEDPGMATTPAAPFCPIGSRTSLI